MPDDQTPGSRRDLDTEIIVLCVRWYITYRLRVPVHLRAAHEERQGSDVRAVALRDRVGVCNGTFAHIDFLCSSRSKHRHGWEKRVMCCSKSPCRTCSS